MKTTPVRIAVATVVAVAATALASAQTQVTKPTVAGVTNFAKLEATIACAGATTATAMPELKKLGYNSIINLREASEQGADIDGAAAAAKEAGIKYVHIPMNRSTPDPSVADKFLKAIVEPANQPVFVHCGSGNRAAAMWMIKRMVIDGWDADKAGIEATALGLTNPTLKQFAIEYAAKNKK